VHKWFSPAAVRLLRQEIEAANNNEVLFTAILEKDMLKDIEVLARGNSTMVPAAVHPQPGKCLLVIHNHPSGDLTPSGADISVASRLSREGIGFAIIDNKVSESYVLVEPVQIQPTAAVPTKLVTAALGPGGHVAKIMPTYEDRPQQLEMAINVAQALNEGSHALAEAGTGIGKSLAYLVPVLMWASENNRRVVVSTNTINLQEQLLYKDIPLLQQALPFGFKAVLVKGRANYLCKRKFQEFHQRGEDLIEEKDLPDLQAMMKWEKTTRDGTRSELGFTPSRDLWEMVCSESDACLRLDCPFFRDCFFHRARRETLDAQVLIVNHSLLFADIALRSKGADTGVLPEYHSIVLDEAHNVERAATDWLGARVTRLSFSRLLARLYNQRGNRAKGLLVVLENKLAAALDLDKEVVRELLETLRQQLVPACARVSQEANGFFEAAVVLFSQQGDKESKLRLPGNFSDSLEWKKLLVQAQALFAATGLLEKSMDILRTGLEYLGPQGFEVVLPQAIELDGIRSRLKTLEADLQEVLMGEEDSLVRWTELGTSRWGSRAAFSYAPLTVSPVLKENLWEKYPSVVLTSATMTVNKSFDYIKERLGLDRTFRVKELQYQSPFNYKEQVRLGIPTDLPDPAQPGFQAKIIPVIRESLLASRGRGLVLFTSFYLLKATSGALREDLSCQGISMLCQGDLPRHRLLEKFRDETHSVLMATSSFWEGVDVPGESLSNLILTRLPFNVPDEPVFQARMEELRSQGSNPFYSFQMPQAVLRFKQGFGRLIRSQRDRGVVLVLDKRIATKAYGSWFLDSLPPCPVRKGPASEILAWQRGFLEID
jgi:ATP-dependent DNA helicase DinG